MFTAAAARRQTVICTYRLFFDAVTNNLKVLQRRDAVEASDDPASMNILAAVQRYLLLNVSKRGSPL